MIFMAKTKHLKWLSQFLSSGGIYIGKPVWTMFLETGFIIFGKVKVALVKCFHHKPFSFLDEFVYLKRENFKFIA